MGKFIDLTGQKFGRLTVIERAPNKYNKQNKPIVMWKCICECGNIKDIQSASLLHTDTVSCGCYGKEQRLRANTKHGLSESRYKRIYYNMCSRCYNPNTPKFNNHGGRGIGVCDEWLGEYGLENFVNWAKNNGYDDSLTLDRIDNNKDYSPENCRWATYEEQNFNRRCNRQFTINGETKYAKEFCEQYGININTFWQRDRAGKTGYDLVRPVIR